MKPNDKKDEFRQKLDALLKSTLDEGPGSRAVGRIAADVLFDFIADEAGAFCPQAVAEVVGILEGRLEDLGPTMTMDEARAALTKLGFRPLEDFT